MLAEDTAGHFGTLGQPATKNVNAAGVGVRVDVVSLDDAERNALVLCATSELNRVGQFKVSGAEGERIAVERAIERIEVGLASSARGQGNGGSIGGRGGYGAIGNGQYRLQ